MNKHIFFEEEKKIFIYDINYLSIIIIYLLTYVIKVINKTIYYEIIQ
jgi:hypothetical protein